MVERDWRPMFETAAQLGHEDLIEKVVDLATRVRDGEGSLVDQIVVHARVLDYRYKNRGTGFPIWLASTPRLSEMQPRGLAYRTRDDPKVMTMNMVQCDDAPMFVATTVGFIRHTFDTGPTPATLWLRSMSLATLPGELPHGSTEPVVLYGTLQGGTSSILSAVRDGRDPAEPVAHVVQRIIHLRPFSWEPGGWDGD
ncbi:hypothetical protein [Saccharopolyspora taberi]|uniref:Uncharacterized protein n=1 Tax=Saccharopolyspora taberi TaxID=60895 RepID=A0ABN3V4P6_9PSEU